MPKRLGGIIIGCKDKDLFMAFNRGPQRYSKIGSKVSRRGETHRDTLHLLTLIDMQGQARTGTRKNSFSLSVQLTTSSIGNLTRLILTLAICDDHTYIHTKRNKDKRHDEPEYIA